MPKNAVGAEPDEPLPYIANPLDCLPETGAERLHILREAADAAGAEVRRLSELALEARGDLRKGERLLQETERTYDEGRMTRSRRFLRPAENLDDLKPRDDPSDSKSPPWKRAQMVVETVEVVRDDKRLAAEREAVSKLRRKLERAQVAYQVASAKAGPLRGLYQRLEDYVGHQLRAHAPLPAYAGPAVKIKAGVDLKGELARLSGQVAALAEEIADVAAAPVPSAEMKAAAAAEIDRLARRGQPAVHLLRNPDADRSQVWPEVQSRDLSSIGADGGTGVVVGFLPDVLGLVCWLEREALLAKLGAMIDSDADDSVALTSDEKAKRLDDLRARKLAAERHEAALLCNALGNDVSIAPRRELDPRAFLDLADILPAPTDG